MWLFSLRQHLRYVAMFATFSPMSDFEPASSVIKKLGGPKIVAGIVGVHRTRVSNWSRSREVGGTGGMIPMKHVARLLDFAKENGIDLSAEDFIPASTRDREQPSPLMQVAAE
jgi:hypothetical protein